MRDSAGFRHEFMARLLQNARSGAVGLSAGAAACGGMTESTDQTQQSSGGSGGGGGGAGQRGSSASTGAAHGRQTAVQARAIAERILAEVVKPLSAALLSASP